ncbi:glycosyltransferase family 2 protein [Tessaracoccus sp. G1721]
MTKASIIIPSRGGAERLPRLLAALAAQTHPDWEAIVVVDGDVDNSEAVVAQYAHLSVRAIVFPENRGRVAALNAGFAAARGEVLIRCDDDLVPSPDYVHEHVSATAGGERGAVGLYVNVFPDTPYAQVYGREADEKHRAQAYATPLNLRYRYWAGNCSVSRDVFDRVGGYDPRYRAYGWEDIDFGYRLQQLGLPVELVPSLETPHYVAATTTEIRVGRAIAAGRARRTFDAIHGAGSSGPSRPEDKGAWNGLVNALADRLNERRAELLARCIDRTLSVMPAEVGRKAVALAVEASAVAGYRLAQHTTVG